MTLLQLVNSVLRELREKTTDNVDTDYAQFLVGLVNRAKREVEEAWDWKALRTEVTWSTVLNQVAYNLGTGGVGSSVTTNRSKILDDTYGRPMVYDTTNLTQLSRMPREIERGYTILNQTPASLPNYFSTTLTGTGVYMRMYPKPNAIYPITAVFKIPQVDLVLATDEMTIPAAEAVYLLAAAYAAAERGGGQGSEAATLASSHQSALSNAIQLDAEVPELTAYQA